VGSLLLPSGLLLIACGLLQLRLVRNVTYPPVLFCGVWGVALVWLWLSGDRYLPLSDTTMVIYVAGALSFTVGGAVGWLGGRPEQAGPIYEPQAADWLIPAMTAAVLLVSPLYVARVAAVVGTVSPVEFLFYLRVRTLDSGLDEGIGIVGNAVPLAMMCAMTSVALPPQWWFGRACRVLLVLLAILLAVLTGGRGAPLTLILSLWAISAVRAQFIPVRTAVLGLAGVMVVFAVMGVFVRKGTARPDMPLSSNILAVGENLQDYVLGGIVAFDLIVDDPRRIPDNGGYLRTLRATANHFGGRYDVPSQHLQFVSIGDGRDTNVFTVYHAYYPDEGLVGSLALILLFGVAASVVHRYATRGGLAPTLFHGVFAASVLLTTFNEPFYTNINFLLKLAVFSVVVSAIVARPAGVAASFPVPRSANT
jgi:hypothetical protein